MFSLYPPYVFFIYRYIFGIFMSSLYPNAFSIPSICLLYIYMTSLYTFYIFISLSILSIFISSPYPYVFLYPPYVFSISFCLLLTLLLLLERGITTSDMTFVFLSMLCPFLKTKINILSQYYMSAYISVNQKSTSKCISTKYRRL